MTKTSKCKKCGKMYRVLAKGTCCICDPIKYYKYYDHLTQAK